MEVVESDWHGMSLPSMTSMETSMSNATRDRVRGLELAQKKSNAMPLMALEIEGSVHSRSKLKVILLIRLT